MQFILLEVEDGIDVALCQKECDYFYYILDGRGYFVIEGLREGCMKNDLVVIPAGKKFIYKGKMKLMLISMPP